MSILPSWSPFFQSAVRMQGRAAQLAGKVRRQPPREDQLLVADVTTETGGVEVTVAADGRHAVAECSCDTFADGQFCPHIWAALLDLAHNEGPGAPIDELSRLRLRAPKARKRDGSERPAHGSGEPVWMGRLTLLRPSADAPRRSPLAALAAAQRQVCYVVLPEASMRARGLVLELQQRSAIATGWSKPKPLKLSADTLDTLADPVDRELGALLLGATRVGDDDTLRLPRSLTQHATYRLMPGAQRSMLRRIIDTGRCFVDLDETSPDRVLRPVRWDAGLLEGDADGAPGVGPRSEPPWVPWLVGHPLPDGLQIELQLRRSGRRVPATQPAMVLGGADGLVLFPEPVDRAHRADPVAVASNLDDRDAYAWIAQFRDPRFVDDGTPQDEDTRRSVLAGAMRIPEEQVPKFLERLYLLPQLPELDLPDGLGHAEHRVEPRPMLDLFSPGTAQATELGATQKSHLAARIWFDYAGMRVNPSRPGRFVPVTDDGDAGGSAVPAAITNQADTSSSSAAPVAPGQAAVPSGSAVATLDGTAADEADELTDVLLPEDDDTDEARRLIRRNFRAEREAIEQTAGLGLCRGSNASPDALLVPSKHVPAVVSNLLLRGWGVYADQKLLRAVGPPALSITSGIDWFELRGQVKYTDPDGALHTVELPAILEAARAGRLMVELDDGSQGLLPEQWLAEHGLLTAMGDLEGDHLRFRTSQAAMLDALLDEKQLVSVDDPFEEARRQIRGFDGIHPVEPEADFHGELRSYQKLGLGWFDFLRRFGMGGVLADDMGLGKTIQVLAMLQARKLSGADATAPTNGERRGSGRGPSGPTLIVAPRSVVFNWLDEAAKFTPELRVLAYTGPDRTQHLKQLGDYDLVVTSYGLMRRDVEKLAEVTFDYAVLDEAQAIKNAASQSAKAARLLRARHRLALTGTPVENHLGDLWSIFEFLNPGMLGANARFSDLVRGATAAVHAEDLAPEAAAEAGGEPEATDAEPPDRKNPKSPLHQLAAALRPFILRRTKQQVLTDLPAKTEQTILCEMEPAQRKVYDDLRSYYRGTLINQLDADGVTAGTTLGRSAFMVLEALLRLRQASCHPALINKDGINNEAPSAKLDALMEMLGEVLEEGQKALVFSQFTSMLALVRERFDALGIKYAYLDGQTRNRKQVVEDFQDDPDVQVFLISLKAGGVGLNLTAAEYVFILDPWWNPAVEAQAIDRTHRIGQTKPVFAYRMICEDTVEQRILELQQRKRDLADAIVGGEQNLLSSLTRDDLEKLLA